MITQITPTHKVTYDGAVFQTYHAGKGEGLERHQHSYAHLTMCHAGSIRVKNDRTEIIMTKDSQPVNLVAIDFHEIEALEDGTVFVNVFAEGKY